MEKLKRIIKETPPSRAVKLSVYAMVIGVGAGWIFFPYILDFLLGKKLALVEGTAARKVWVKLPPLVTKMYLFNVTNSEEVQNGAVPQLEQIGPYCYLSHKEKLALVDDEESDTVTYSQRSTWYWTSSPTCQQTLTGNEIIVQPNAFLLALLLKAKKDFPTPLMAVINEALPGIYGRLRHVFISARAHQLLFDGVLINCTERSLLPRAVCVAVKQNSKPLVEIAPNVYLFSYLGARNHTIEEYRYTVMRGVNNILDLGRLVQIDGKTELPFWKGECNRIFGTDSTIFPPYRKPDNASFTSYSSDLCRVLRGYYEKEERRRGIVGHKYVITLGDATEDVNYECYCEKPSSCKRGTSTFDTCLGAPLIATFPHFYDTNAEFERGVVGLSPTKELHETYAILEPTSGVPLSARRRLQINIQLQPIRYVPITKKLRPTLCPLIWLEEAFELDDNFVGMLQNQLLLGMTTMDAVKWALIAVGAVLAGASGYLYSRKMVDRKRKIDNAENISVIQLSPDKSNGDRFPETLDNVHKNYNNIQKNMTFNPDQNSPFNEQVLLPGMLPSSTSDKTVENFKYNFSNNDLEQENGTKHNAIKINNNESTYRENTHSLNSNEKFLTTTPMTVKFITKNAIIQSNNSAKYEETQYRGPNELNIIYTMNKEYDTEIKLIENLQKKPHTEYDTPSISNEEKENRLQNIIHDYDLDKTDNRRTTDAIDKSINTINDQIAPEIGKVVRLRSTNPKEFEDTHFEDHANEIYNSVEGNAQLIINKEKIINESRSDLTQNINIFNDDRKDTNEPIVLNGGHLRSESSVDVQNKTEERVNYEMNYAFGEEVDELDDRITELKRIDKRTKIRTNWRKAMKFVQATKLKNYKKKEEIMDSINNSFGDELRDFREMDETESTDLKQSDDLENNANTFIRTPNYDVGNKPNDGLNEAMDRKVSSSGSKDSSGLESKLEGGLERVRYPNPVNIHDVLGTDDDLSDGTVTVVGAWSGPIIKRRMSRDSLSEDEN